MKVFARCFPRPVGLAVVLALFAAALLGGLADPAGSRGPRAMPALASAGDAASTGQSPERMTTRVNLTADGGQANQGPRERCFGPPCPAGGRSATVSAEGRFVAFESMGDNLVPGDTNKAGDVFVRDRLRGTTERVSVTDDGAQANERSFEPSISVDGRFVAFSSWASNLTGEGVGGVFVRDRREGTTERIAVAPDGTPVDAHSPSISADGRFVAFTSRAGTLVEGDTNDRDDVFVRDRQAGTTERVSVASDGSQANESSYQPAISGNGQVVAFHSKADSLVADDTNEADDVFVHDRQAGTTERVSVASNNTQANDESAHAAVNHDGGVVAFQSRANTLVREDTNGASDVFVRDRQAGTTERVSVTSDDTQASDASYEPALNDEGDLVAFDSTAGDLVPGDTNDTTDVFVRDRQAGTTERASVASDHTQGDGPSGSPALAAGGRVVAFQSGAANLVPGDTNDTLDIFARHRGLPTPVCPVGEVPAAGFVDRDAVPSVHRHAVDCAAWHDIVSGFADNAYRPGAAVPRDQMATFIAGTLTAAGITLPDPAEDSFDDVAADSPHRQAIHRLAAADIVRGGPGTDSADAYGPHALVRRDQMASFLLRAAAFALDKELASQQQSFDDVTSENPHFGAVNGAAAEGLAEGTSAHIYQPAAPVHRDQMASFTIRLLARTASS